MYKINTLYKIDDTTVFYSSMNTYELSQLLKNGTSFSDVFGKVMTREDAELGYAIMTGQFRPANAIEGVCRNIEMSSIIIAIVRVELANEPNGTEYVSKLQPAIAMACVGMFNDASNYILSLIPDDDISEDMLIRWADLLLSSNSVADI